MEVLDRGNLGVKFWMDGIEYFIAGYAIVLSIDIYESLLISRVCVCVLIYSQSSPFSLPLFRNNTEEIFRTSLFSLGNFRLLLPPSKLVVLIGRTTCRGHSGGSIKLKSSLDCEKEWKGKEWRRICKIERGDKQNKWAGRAEYGCIQASFRFYFRAAISA